MKPKKVFVINGNHDGVLAIATNKKRAYEIASSYCHNNPDITYSQLCKQMREDGFVYVKETPRNDIIATVTYMYLNQF